MMAEVVPSRVVEVWDKYNLPENVRRHCIKVAEVATRIARAMKSRGVDVDEDAVLMGALLHDIGRAITHEPFQHFVLSGEILRKEGFDEKIVRIAERHFSAGITKEEAEILGLPPKSYMPESLEEKIVCFADNIVFGDTEVTFEDYMQKLDRIAERDIEHAWLVERTKERAIKLKEEIESLISSGKHGM
jgi:uncharacterized protein